MIPPHRQPVGHPASAVESVSCRPGGAAQAGSKLAMGHQVITWLVVSTMKNGGFNH